MIDQLVRDLRPETTEPDPITVLRARRALLRGAISGRIRRRRGVRIAVALTAAAATAVVIGVVQTPEHGATPAAAVLRQSANQLETRPAAVSTGTYRRLIQMGWEYGPSAADPSRGSTEPWVDDSVETWIPDRPDEPLVQRTTDENGKKTWAVVAQQDSEAYPLLRTDRAPGPLLDALREYAHRIGNDGDAGVWGSAAMLMIDPQLPDDLRADILRALAGLDGVTVLDGQVEIDGRSGTALRYPEKHPLDLVFDPADDAFLGVRGNPERDKDWVGPGEPYWLAYFETDTDASPPPLPRHLRD